MTEQTGFALMVGFFLIVGFVSDLIPLEDARDRVWAAVGRGVQRLHSYRLQGLMRAATDRAIAEHTIILRRGLWE